MKRIFSVQVFVVMSLLSHSQPNDSSASRLLFTSYIGISRVTSELKSNVNNGFLAMTGLEYRLKNRQSLFGEINFDTYKYSSGSSTYSIDGNLSTIALTVGYKYLLSAKKLAPYFKAGAGAARVSMPFAETKSGFTSVTNKSNLSFQYQFSGGLNYSIGKSYSVFVDAGFQQYFTGSFINQNLSNTGIKVGVTSSF